MNEAMPSYRLITAAVLLIAYLTVACILLWLLYNHRGQRAPDWDHVLVIFNAIGALATAAVGVLLGVEIQQGNVNSAQQRAERSAAAAARKDMAIMTALNRLDAATPTAAAAGADTAIIGARAALHAALSAAT